MKMLLVLPYERKMAVFVVGKEKKGNIYVMRNNNVGKQKNKKDV
jgi:hypothetical protein